MKHKSLFITFVLVIAILIPLYTGKAQGVEPITNLKTTEESLKMDAGMYAKDMGVSLDEAIHRLSLQKEIGDLNSKLEMLEKETFAGLWISHSPVFRVEVRFTREGESTIQRYLGDAPLKEIVSVGEAKYSLRELEEGRAFASKMAETIGIKANSGINVFENQAELYVLSIDELDNVRQSFHLTLPQNVKLVEVPELAKDVAFIYGGLSIDRCTSGFSVQSYGGTKGITTAGHCPDTQSYNGFTLPYVSGTTGGTYDIQWNTAPNFTPINAIWIGSTTRSILSVAYKSSQAVGSYVCKYGMTSGYSCGTIFDNNWEGANIRVHTSVSPGDSGGPFFYVNTAYGTTIASQGSDAIYGPIDNIVYILGVLVLTN